MTLLYFWNDLQCCIENLKKDYQTLVQTSPFTKTNSFKIEVRRYVENHRKSEVYQIINYLDDHDVVEGDDPGVAVRGAAAARLLRRGQRDHGTPHRGDQERREGLHRRRGNWQVPPQDTEPPLKKFVRVIWYFAHLITTLKLRDKNAKCEFWIHSKVKPPFISKIR